MIKKRKKPREYRDYRLKKKGKGQNMNAAVLAPEFIMTQRKQTFNVEDDEIAELLERLTKRLPGLKTKFINSCIRLAKDEALRELQAELSGLSKADLPPAGKAVEQKRKP